MHKPRPPRSLSRIAADIRTHWKNVSPFAVPFLNAMATLESIDDAYFSDSARSVVLYFLANASTWRGEKARAIKAELSTLLEQP